MEMLTISGLVVAAIIVAALSKGWIDIYNKFVYWINNAEQKFANIDVIMQQRIDMLPALAQAVKKYDIHEYKALKDIMEARGGWKKDAPINEKVNAANKIDNSFIKIQALSERYPELKAFILHKSIMGRGSISKIEQRLSKYRLAYNYVARKYNERVMRFPRNIVAIVHGFKKLNYLALGNQINQGPQEVFKPRELFDE